MSVVDRLRELEAAATPGPWEWPHENALAGNYSEGFDSGWTLVAAIHDAGPVSPENAALIAAMRNALPALLDIAEAAKACAERAYRGYGPEEAGWWSTLTDLEDALARLDDAAGQP